MTLPEAYRILRRYEDFRIGFDHRCVCDAFPSGEHREAVQLILASRWLGQPLMNCDRCVHEGVGSVCRLHVRGECKMFKAVE